MQQREDFVEQSTQTAANPQGGRLLHGSKTINSPLTQETDIHIPVCLMVLQLVVAL